MHNVGVIPVTCVILYHAMTQPLYFLELAIGQFSSSNCTKVWRMVPPFKGTSPITSYSYSAEVNNNTLSMSANFPYYINQSYCYTKS